MKKIILSIGALGFLALVSCGPSAKDALAYNDNIMSIVNKATIAQNDFFEQTDGHNLDSLMLIQKQYSEKSKACLDEITKLTAFADKKEFLDAAINFVKSANTMADNEGKQMMEIMVKDTASITDEDIHTVEVLNEKINAESNKVSKEITDAQQAFAKEWKFEIGNETEKH